MSQKPALTPKQEAFVREYLVDLNASAAARRAGYSARTAEWQGPQLLRKTHVAEAIGKAQAARAERTEIGADWVLKRLHAEATADLSDLYDANGNLKPVREWPMIWRTGLVAGIETVQERDGVDADGNPQWVTVRKVKLSDRVRQLELIGKHVDIGAFRDQVAHTGKNGGPIEVARPLASLSIDEIRAALSKLGK